MTILPQITAITQTNVDEIAGNLENNADQVQTIAQNLGLTEREVRELNEAAQHIKGNIKIQTSKLFDIERSIKEEQDKLVA